MTNQTEAILARIRECCPELMELSFGCEVITQKGSRGIVGWGGDEYMRCVRLENGNTVQVGLRHITSIGHEPHLEHLLRTLPFEVQTKMLYAEEGNELQLGYDDHADENSFTIWCQYNLTLTVRENLEKNEELREWIYELICK